MDYKNIKQEGSDLLLTGVRHFIPAQILDCGQCFRWRELGRENYAGITRGRFLNIYLSGDTLIFKDTTEAEFYDIWLDYFDLRRDYGELHEIYAKDEILSEAIKYSPGLRLVKQEPWEALISFILSQNSNIPRIKGMVARLCSSFGKALPEGGNAFPHPKDLAYLSKEDLAQVKTGYRDAYLIDAAKKVESGEINLDEIEKLPPEEASKALKGILGVGPKVADCVLLFGFGKTECYPSDVWVKKIMAKHYPQGFPPEIKKTAGIAQQFLFHYFRTLQAPL